MINSSNLMIGDLVKFKSKIAKVVGIGRSNFDPIIIQVYDNYLKIFITKSVSEEEINPITITISFLEKCGFEKEVDGREFLEFTDYKIDLGNCYHISLNDYCSNSQDKSWSIHIDNINFSTIGSGDLEYFHELQNIIRILCNGLELPELDKLIKSNY